MGTMLATPLRCEKGVRPGPDASMGVSLTGEGPTRPDNVKIYIWVKEWISMKKAFASTYQKDLPIPGENKLGENNLPPEAGSSIPKCAKSGVRPGRDSGIVQIS